MVEGGANIVAVSRILGHADLRTTMRYSHPAPEHKKQAVERLNSGTMDTYLDTSYTNKGSKEVVTIRNY